MMYPPPLLVSDQACAGIRTRRLARCRVRLRSLSGRRLTRARFRHRALAMVDARISGTETSLHVPTAEGVARVGVPAVGNHRAG